MLARTAPDPPAGSEPYEPDNVLDRLSRRSTLEHYYAHMMRRERLLVDRRLGARPAARCCRSGAAGTPAATCSRRPRSGWSASTRSPIASRGVLASGRADEALVGYAGRLELDPAVVRRGPLPAGAPPPRVPRPLDAVLLRGGAAASPRRRAGRDRARPVASGRADAGGSPTAPGRRPRCTGRPTTFPLSPARLIGEAARRGRPRLPSSTRSPTCWRRLAPALQDALAPLDALGSRPRAAPFGHTLMLIARKPAARMSVRSPDRPATYARARGLVPARRRAVLPPCPGPPDRAVQGAHRSRSQDPDRRHRLRRARLDQPRRRTSTSPASTSTSGPSTRGHSSRPTPQCGCRSPTTNSRSPTATA